MSSYKMETILSEINENLKTIILLLKIIIKKKQL